MTPKGRLIIIGGKEDKSETVPEMEDVNHGFIPKEILKLIAESKDDRIEIVTTSTSDPDDMEKTYSQTFKDIGYTNFGFLYITQKDNKESLQRLQDLKQYFFPEVISQKSVMSLKIPRLLNGSMKDICMNRISQLPVPVQVQCVCHQL